MCNGFSIDPESCPSFPRDVPHVCGIVLLRQDGAALLQLRDDKPEIPDPNIWVFPGGHVEDHESLLEGARREFFEEANYKCGELHWLTSCSTEGLGYDFSLRMTFFWTEYDRKQSFKCGEGQDLRFVLREEVQSLAIQPYLPVVWDMALNARNARRALYSRLCSESS